MEEDITEEDIEGVEIFIYITVSVIIILLIAQMTYIITMRQKYSNMNCFKYINREAPQENDQKESD